MTIIRTNVKTDKNCQEEDVKICIIKRQQYQNRGNINFAHCMNCERFEQMAKAHDDEVAAAKNFMEKGRYAYDDPKDGRGAPKKAEEQKIRYKHTCPQCGKDFENSKIDSIYCNKECYLAAVRAQNAANFEKKAEEKTKKLAQKALKKVKPLTKPCERCGIEIVATSGRKKYCDKCAHELDKEHKREAYRRRVESCGKTVNPCNGRPRTDEPDSGKVACRFCGKAYDQTTVEGKFNHGMFCSQECVDNWLAKFPPDNISRKLEAGVLENADVDFCLICDKLFIKDKDKKEYNGLRFCSEKCAKELVNKRVTLERDPKEPEKLKCVVKDEPKTEQPKPVFNVPSKVDQLIFVWRQKGAELQARKTMLEVEAKHNEEMLGLVREFLKDLSFIPRSNN